MAFQDLLIELEVYLNGLDVPILQALHPGISKQELLNFLLDEFGIDSIENNLVELYNWHNGTDSIFFENKEPYHVWNYSLLPNFSFLDLSTIKEYLIGVDNFYAFKKMKRLPFFTSYTGQHLAIDISDNDTKGLIYYVSVEYPYPENYTSIFNSLETMLNTYLACFKLAVFEKEDSFLDIKDLDLYYEIGAKYNPMCDYWGFYTDPE